jgi:hypothetical protein
MNDIQRDSQEMSVCPLAGLATMHKEFPNSDTKIIENTDSKVSKDMEMASKSNYAVPVEKRTIIDAPGSTYEERFPGNGMAIATCSVGGRHDIYSLTVGGHIYKLENDKEWNLINTGKFGFVNISCGKGALFAVGAHDHELYQLVEGTFIKVLIDSTLKMSKISTVNSKKLFGLCMDSMPHILDIKHGTEASATMKRPSWVQIGTQQLRVLSAGNKKLLQRQEIWGIGLDDFAYRCTDPIKKTWTKVGTQKLKALSVSQDNAVYAVGLEDGILMKWDKREKFVPIEKAMQKSKEHMMINISAYKEHRFIMAVDGKTGHVVKIRRI